MSRKRINTLLITFISIGLGACSPEIQPRPQAPASPANDAKTKKRSSPPSERKTSQTPLPRTSDSTTKEPSAGPASRQPDAQAPPAHQAAQIFGVMAGAVREHEAKIWVGATGPATVQVTIEPETGGKTTQSPRYQARLKTGYQVIIPFKGLTPHTHYRYRVHLGKNPAHVVDGRFRTAPNEDVATRIAFSADIGKQAKFHDRMSVLTASKSDLYLSLGDWPYADLGVPAMTIEDYRRKHRQNRQAKAIRGFMRSVAIHATWDDHEAVNDWDAGSESAWPDRIQAAKQAWREGFPITGAPEGEIYRKHRWGPQIEIFILDTRSHRDANDSFPSDHKSMLGKKQRDWLLKGLSESQAAFKLVVTSVPLVYGTTGNDRWQSFAAEKKRIFDAISKHRIHGVMFLTGDQHWLAVHHLPQGPKEFQAGPLAQYVRRPNRNVPEWVVTQQATRNFITLDYRPGTPPRMQVSAWGKKGELLYTEKVLAGAGQITIQTRHATSRWILRGAHTFVGQGSSELKLATPGRYQISWERPTEPKTWEPGSARTLKAEGHIRFKEPPYVPVMKPVLGPK